MSCENTYNFEIIQGETFVLNINYLNNKRIPIDLSSYKARMQLRVDYSTPVLLELTTENGRIELNNPTGRIKLTVDSETTAALDFNLAIYDLELYNEILVDDEYVDNVVINFLRGTIKLQKEVTK
jgi:hypothetical protein